MLIKQFYRPELAIYTYLIGDPYTRKCAVVDPCRLVEPILQLLQQQLHGWEITHILETHVHADFISGSKELKYRLNDKPTICCSALGGEAWVPAYADQLVQDSDAIQLGTIRIQAKHTPGHTPEHLIWLAFDETRSADVPCLAFSGDLLFVGGVGRPDLLGEQHFLPLAKELYQSLFERLALLPDFLEIYPAHGAGSLCGKSMSTRSQSTLGYERLFNPSLKFLPEEQWIQELIKEMPAVPTAFAKIKTINVQGPTFMKEIVHPLSLLPPEELMQSFVIDARSPEAFSAGHIKGSLNIPSGGQFCNWVGMVVSDQIPLALIATNEQEVEHLANQLSLMGYDRLVGYSTAEELSKHSEKLESLPLHHPKDIFQKAFWLIDVRTPAEWRAGHIRYAHHIELAKLPSALPQIPLETHIAVTCGSGYRASIAASLLKKAGFTTVVNIQGGMQSWQQSNLPVVTGD